MPSIVLGVGYIGSALVEFLVERGEKVVGLDNLFSTDTDALDHLVQSTKGQFRLHIGDILSPTDLEAAFDAVGQNAIVYNLAAQSSADATVAPAELTEDVNLRGPRLVLEAAARYGARAVVFGSSARVLGPSLPRRVDDDSPYGFVGDLSHLSKIYAEKLHEAYAVQKGLACASVRLGLAYGVAPVMKRDYRFMTAPNKFCLQATRGETIVVNLGGPVGLIHVRDAAAALATAAEMCKPRSATVLNAITEARTIEDVARAVATAASCRESTVEIRTTGEAHDPVAVDFGTSALAGAGFTPQYYLGSGIAEALDHFLRHVPAQ